MTRDPIYVPDSVPLTKSRMVSVHTYNILVQAIAPVLAEMYAKAWGVMQQKENEQLQS